MEIFGFGLPFLAFILIYLYPKMVEIRRREDGMELQIEALTEKIDVLKKDIDYLQKLHTILRNNMNPDVKKRIEKEEYELLYGKEKKD